MHRHNYHFIAYGILLILVLAVLCCTPVHADEVSKADILATVVHLQQLTHDAQAEPVAAKSDLHGVQQAYDTQGSKLAWYVTAYPIEVSARAEAEKERDSMIWIFSIAVAVTALTGALPLLKAFSGLERILVIVAVFGAGFSIGFTIGRYALHFLAKFTPHLPF